MAAALAGGPSKNNGSAEIAGPDNEGMDIDGPDSDGPIVNELPSRRRFIQVNCIFYPGLSKPANLSVTQ